MTDRSGTTQKHLNISVDLDHWINKRCCEPQERFDDRRILARWLLRNDPKLQEFLVRQIAAAARAEPES